MSDDLRMEAYFYGFEHTSRPEVDKVLSAVACAGKAYHSTSDWQDDCDWPPHTGRTPVGWIQNAANEAAAAFSAEKVRGDGLVSELLSAKEAWGLLSARADALEADCAAMRKALEAAQWGGGALGMKCPDQRCGNYRPRHQPDCAIGMALAPDSGKRLLEELAAKDKRIAELEGYARPAAEPLGIASLTDGGMDD